MMCDPCTARTREARKHFTKDEALQNSTNLLHCVVDSTSGVLCMLCAILIMVAGLAIGTKVRAVGM